MAQIIVDRSKLPVDGRTDAIDRHLHSRASPRYLAASTDVPATTDRPEIFYVEGPPEEIWLVTSTGKRVLGFSVHAAATDALTLLTSFQDIAGTDITLPKPGVYTVVATFDFNYVSAVGDTIAEGILATAAGVAIDAPREAIFEMSATGDRATVSQTWRVTTTADDESFILRGRRSGGAGSAAAQLTHTTIAAFSMLGGGSTAASHQHAHVDTTGRTTGDHHDEDHAHDGGTVQQLLAANTHESPSTDTHHAKAHTIGGADHTGNLAHSDLSDAPTNAHHAISSQAPTFVVAANDANARVKSAADYLCDGTADDVQIQAAIDALPAGGGKVLLSEGTFNITSSIVPSDDMMLEGVGESTILFAVAGLDDDVIGTPSSGILRQALFQDFKINGNRNNQASGDGIFLYAPRYCVIERVSVDLADDHAIHFGGEAAPNQGFYNWIHKCHVSLCDGDGIRIENGTEFNIISENIVRFIGADGIFCSVTNDRIINNTLDSVGGDSIHVEFGAGRWIITGNDIDRPSGAGIMMRRNTFGIITSNRIGGLETDQIGIGNGEFDTSDDNGDNVIISDNVVTIKSAATGTTGISESHATDGVLYKNNQLTEVATAISMHASSTNFTVRGNPDTANLTFDTHAQMTGQTADDHHDEDHDLFSAVHTDLLLAAAEATGDIMVRNSSGKWTNLPLGDNSDVLFATGLGPTWLGGDIFSTVVDHQLMTGVEADDHHTKYLDSEARTAVPFVSYISFGAEPITGQSYAP